MRVALFTEGKESPRGDDVGMLSLLGVEVWTFLDTLREPGLIVE